MARSAAVIFCASLGCAASLPGAGERVWSRAVVQPAGSAGLALDIRNEVAQLGSLRAVAAVLDGEVIFRASPWDAGGPGRQVTLSTTPGRHQLCLVALYTGGPAAPNDTFLVRAPRLVQLTAGTLVSTRVHLEEQLGPQPYATARYEGGLPYAETTTPDPARYESRLDELCGNR